MNEIINYININKTISEIVYSVSTVFKEIKNGKKRT